MQRYKRGGVLRPPLSTNRFAGCQLKIFPQNDDSREMSSKAWANSLSSMISNDHELTLKDDANARE